MRKKERILLQKEFLFTHKQNKCLSTFSVRGCYAVVIYHPKASALLHWDDNTRRSELQKFIKIYQKKGRLLDTTVTVTLIGGWIDNIESKKSGDFLLNYFSQTAAILNTDYFQIKQESGLTDAQQGFAYVRLDTNTSRVYVSDDWQKHSFCYKESDKTAEKIKLIQWLDATHLQVDEYPDSGTCLINKKRYKNQQKKGAKKLICAVKDNDSAELIRLLEHKITSVNSTYGNSLQTPLHHACKQEKLEIIYLLLLHGGDLFKEDKDNNTPYNHIKTKDCQKKSLAIYQLVQLYIAEDIYKLRNLSIFSRTPARLSPEERSEMTNLVQYMIEPANCADIDYEFNRKFESYS